MSTNLRGSLTEASHLYRALGSPSSKEGVRIVLCRKVTYPETSTSMVRLIFVDVAQISMSTMELVIWNRVNCISYKDSDLEMFRYMAASVQLVITSNGRARYNDTKKVKGLPRPSWTNLGS